MVDKSKLFAALLVLGLPASCAVAEWRAEAQARAFCEKFPVGSAFEEAVKEARASGHQIKSWPEGKVAVMYVGVPPFSRHICDIRNADGVVVEADYVWLD